MIGTIIGGLIFVGVPLLIIIAAIVVSSKYDEGENRK